MADAAEKEKADKLAAAKKRFEQIKKQKEKGKKPGEKTEKKKVASKPTPEDKSLDIAEKEDPSSVTEPVNDEAPSHPNETENPESQENHEINIEPGTPTRPMHGRQPSLSLQSKIRSSSFRKASGSISLSPTANGGKSVPLPPLSPDGDAVTEIYRKQAGRIEDLERENKRLAKDAEVAENRWRKTEEELEELRENTLSVEELKARAKQVDSKTEEINKLKSDLTALQRQNTNLQSLTHKGPRHSTSPSQATAQPASDLQAQLDSKSAAMESMELEISKLRAQIDKNSSSTASHSEQVSALEAKLERAERAAGSAQRELLDLRKNVERMSEKAVKEGSERTSAETKIRSLTREAEASTKNGEEALKRVDTLEKKLAALTTLHKDSDARRQNGEREKESINREVGELRKKMAGLENENLRFKEDRDRVRRKELSGTDDDGLDELEDEERNKLESRIRDLEGELFESRKGAWRERKRELQAVREDESSTSPGGGFDEVDLSGPIGTRRQSIKGSVGLTSMLSSGFNALAGGGERGSLELMDDDDAMFDEDAFRAAHEEEAKKRIERVKEVKRGLKDWEGYRIDIVDLRMGDSNAGDIFDI